MTAASGQSIAVVNSVIQIYFIRLLIAFLETSKMFKSQISRIFWSSICLLFDLRSRVFDAMMAIAGGWLFLDGCFNYKTVGKKAVHWELQLDVSSVAIATTIDATHFFSVSFTHMRNLNSEKRRNDDLAAAVIQLSLIILRLSHTSVHSQFEHSEKVKSNFNNYIITLWASSTPANHIIVIIVARVRGEPSFENHAPANGWKTTLQLMSAKCASSAQHNEMRSKE